MHGDDGLGARGEYRLDLQDGRRRSGFVVGNYGPGGQGPGRLESLIRLPFRGLLRILAAIGLAPEINRSGFRTASAVIPDASTVLAPDAQTRKAHRHDPRRVRGAVRPHVTSWPASRSTTAAREGMFSSSLNRFTPIHEGVSGAPGLCPPRRPWPLGCPLPAGWDTRR